MYGLTPLMFNILITVRRSSGRIEGFLSGGRHRAWLDSSL